MLSGAVGGFSPCTSLRSMRLAATFWRTCMGDIGSVRGRPSVGGLRWPSGCWFIPASSLSLTVSAAGLVKLLTRPSGVDLACRALPGRHPGLVFQRAEDLVIAADEVGH